jgi:hypothetical protein
MDSSSSSSGSLSSLARRKSVHFYEGVKVILIPCCEELPTVLLWWSSRELQAMRRGTVLASAASTSTFVTRPLPARSDDMGAGKLLRSPAPAVFDTKSSGHPAAAAVQHTARPDAVQQVGPRYTVPCRV